MTRSDLSQLRVARAEGIAADQTTGFLDIDTVVHDILLNLPPPVGFKGHSRTALYHVLRRLCTKRAMRCMPYAKWYASFTELLRLLLVMPIPLRFMVHASLTRLICSNMLAPFPSVWSLFTLFSYFVCLPSWTNVS